MIKAREPGLFGGFLTGPILVATFTLLTLCVALGWPLNLIGWGFASIGLSLLLPRLIALRTWNAQVATVIEVGSYEEGQLIKVQYLVGSQTYVASCSSAFENSIGDSVTLFIHPRKPATYMSFNIVLMVIAIMLVAVGGIFGLTEPVYSHNWIGYRP